MKSFKDYSKQAADVANAQQNGQQQESATAEQLAKKNCGGV